VAAPAGGDRICQGSEIRLGTNGDARNINPLFAIDTDGYWRSDLLFDPLVKEDWKTLQPVPHLAERWTISPDGKTYTFNLKKGVTWHDGKPLTARDVEFTVLAMLAPDYNGQWRTNWSVLVGADDVIAGKTKSLAGLRVVDDHTIQMRLKQPTASFLAVTVRNLKPVPRHILEGQRLADDTEYSRAPVGSGPYKFEQWVRGDRFVAVANESYWGGAPCMKRIVQVVIPDMNALLVALEAGQLDASIVLPPQELPRLARSGSLVVYNLPAQVPEGLHLNLSNDMFKDPKIRRAIAHAVDWSAFSREVMRGTTKAATHIAPASWAADKTIQPIKYDVERAKSLLKEAGQPNGFELDIYTNAGNLFREQAVNYMQGQLAKVGIRVKPRFNEWGTFISAVRRGEFITNFQTALGGVPDPDVLYLQYHSTGGQNYAKYKNPEVDKLLDEARLIANAGQRAQRYKKVQQILLNDLPYIPAFWRPNALTIRTRFAGVRPSLAGAYWNINEFGIRR
jgi:peptide/nickel transport system substrate-binding protein